MYLLYGQLLDSQSTPPSNAGLFSLNSLCILRVPAPAPSAHPHLPPPPCSSWLLLLLRLSVTPPSLPSPPPCFSFSSPPPTPERSVSLAAVPLFTWPRRPLPTGSTQSSHHPIDCIRSFWFFFSSVSFPLITIVFAYLAVAFVFCVSSCPALSCRACFFGTPEATGNTMYHPCDPAAWFAMLVYKNGSLTREGVRDRRARGSWEAFSMYDSRTLTALFFSSTWNCCCLGIAVKATSTRL